MSGDATSLTLRQKLTVLFNIWKHFIVQKVTADSNFIHVTFDFDITCLYSQSFQ